MNHSPIMTIALGAVLASAASAADTPLMDERIEDDPRWMNEPTLHHSGMPVNDVRIGVGVVASPRISERLRSAGGTRTYDWKDSEATGLIASLSRVAAWNRFAMSWGVPLYGASLSYEHIDTTPDRYETGGASFQNNRPDITLDYQSAHIDLLFGWATPPADTEVGDLHGEFLLFAGGGAAWASTQAFTAASLPEHEQGLGYVYEYGARLGGYLCRAQWLFGVHGDYIISTARVGVDLPNQAHSELDISGSGFAAQVEIGYRY
jgi:hypothetical protein